MTATNFTCFFFYTGWEQGEKETFASVALCVLCALLALTAISGNGIVIFVIWSTQELHSPSLVLLLLLAASDFLVGLVGQPFFVAFKIAESLRYFSAYCNLRLIQFFSGWITSGVSFITLSAISVDRLLALILHLRYKNIITVRRVIIAVIVVWLVCSIVTILKFWLQNWIIIAVCTNLSAAVVIAFCTGKIFRIARRHERRIKEQNVAITLNPSLAGDFNVRKCKKSAMTVIYIFGLMLMLYIPFFAVMAVEIIKGKTNLVKVAYEWASLIVFINSSVNPVIYCWRMKQIRNGIKRFFGRLICPRIASSCCIHLVGLAAGSERS